MRRAEKQIVDPELVAEVLGACHVGRLGTVGRDGYPRVKPLNYVYEEGRIYFHTAREGEKIEDLARDERVCFEVDLPLAYVRPSSEACQANYLFRSVIALGRARLVQEEAEKLEALTLLMKKYGGPSQPASFSEKGLKAVGVVRIDLEQVVGKEHLGEGSLREAALDALARGQSPGLLTV